MRMSPERHGGVLRLRAGCYEEYKRYHAQVWPEVLALISSCHIRNYSIFHHDGLLFGFFEYWGEVAGGRGHEFLGNLRFLGLKAA